MDDAGVEEIMKWAERSAHFAGKEMEDFVAFVRVVQPTCNTPECISDGIKIDEGAFGSIAKATFTAPDKVCVTRVCCRRARMRDICVLRKSDTWPYKCANV
jgi:hypothetical protein